MSYVNFLIITFKYPSGKKLIFVVANKLKMFSILAYRPKANIAPQLTLYACYGRLSSMAQMTLFFVAVAASCIAIAIQMIQCCAYTQCAFMKYANYAIEVREASFSNLIRLEVTSASFSMISFQFKFPFSFSLCHLFRLFTDENRFFLKTLYVFFLSFE